MSKDVHLVQLGLSEGELELFEQKRVEYKQKSSKIFKKSRAESKNSNCYVCGNKCSSFCNSHSIPRFCLENIAIKGDVYHSASLVDLPMLDKEKGIKEAGTFNIICNDCDSIKFRDYENPENYLIEPTDKMLSQIAMKNYLKNISKREFEISLYNNISELSGNDMSHNQSVNTLDLNEYKVGFEYAKKASESKWDNNYFLCYFEILDYVVPLAFQNNVSLVSDLEGQIINDIYNHSPEYVLKDIHICVFPLENQSIILMFIKNGENRYRMFIKQFRKLSGVEKLKVINFIIFSYSEDFFLYKGIDESLLSHEELKKVAKQSTIAIASSPFGDALQEAVKTYDINKRNTIPNLLDRKYKVR